MKKKENKRRSILDFLRDFEMVSDARMAFAKGDTGEGWMCIFFSLAFTVIGLLVGGLVISGIVALIQNLVLSEVLMWTGGVGLVLMILIGIGYIIFFKDLEDEEPREMFWRHADGSIRDDQSDRRADDYFG